MAKSRTTKGRRSPATPATLRLAGERVFARYGYRPVNPPMADEASMVLQLTGEEIRRQLVIGSDPTGREICLRPDLTLPTCRQLLASGWNGRTVERLSYRGPIFRAEPEEGFKESLQIGIECLGPLDPPLADAEVVAAAARFLEEAGLGDATLVLGDVALHQAFLNHVVPSPARRLRLERDRAGSVSVPALRGLHLLSQADAEVLVTNLMTAVGIDRVGARSLGEIVSRLIDSSAAADESDERASDLLARYRKIAGPPQAALPAIVKLWHDAGLAPLPVLRDAETRLSLLEALGVDLTRLCFEAALKPDFDYYTGHVFEIRTKGRVIGAGGRYDGLLRALGLSGGAPACGFALTLEAIDEETDGGLDSTLDAIVTGSTPALAIESAEALRAGGWRVAVEGPGGTRNARYTVSAEKGRGKTVTIVERGKRRGETLAPGALTDFARDNPCA